ncbi:MAG: glycine--tRNA ligase subunit beta [Enterobacteriaceae bacterium]
MINFLIEIITEELPQKRLFFFGKKFFKEFIRYYAIFKIVYEKIYWFASSRRLSVKTINIRYLNNKNNTKTNINVNSSLKKDLIKIIDNILIFISKYESMNWGEENFSFVRPVFNILLLFNDKIFKYKNFGLKSNNFTFGHLSSLKKIKVRNVNDYPLILYKKGYVIASFNKRKRIILSKIKEISKKMNLIFDIKNNFINEITSIVEYPKIEVGIINNNFVNLPKVIIKFIIQDIQKCIVLYYLNKNISPYFLIVTNSISKNLNNVIFWNETTINSKLSNINYLFNEDKKIKFSDRILLLKKVIFYKKLGSMFEKSKRIKILSKKISYYNDSIDIKLISRASLMSKCEITTNLFAEMPEMKGIIGMKYSELNKENKLISLAQKEHHYPRFIKDRLPKNAFSSIISIADKIDTIVGHIGIFNIPKGSNDPYFIKRTATAIIRIILNKEILLNLKEIIDLSVKLYKNRLLNTNVIDDTLYFILKRLKNFYSLKVRKDIINSLNEKKFFNLVIYKFWIDCLNKLKNLHKLKYISKIQNRIFKLTKKNIKTFKELNYVCKKEEECILKKLLRCKNKVSFLFLIMDFDKIIFEIFKISNLIENFVNKFKIFSNDKSKTNYRIKIILNYCKLFKNTPDFRMLKF